MKVALLPLLLLIGSGCLAQAGPPAMTPSAPHYAIAAVPQTTFAYRPISPIQIDLSGTWLLPKAHGEAQVSPEPDGLHIDVTIKGLCSASDLGPAYLTYVLWAASPGDKARNLGEITLVGSTGRVAATTELSAFAMFITAEPYFAVSEPSDAVVLKNIAPQGLLRYNLAPDLLPLIRDRETPLDLVQARNAVRIARRLGAERLAATALDKAVGLLSEAEQNYRGDNLWQTVLKAREAIEAAEVARLIAAKAQSE